MNSSPERAKENRCRAGGVTDDASSVYADQSNHNLFEQVAFFDLLNLHCADWQAEHAADSSYVGSFLPRLTVRQQVITGIRNRLVRILGPPSVAPCVAEIFVRILGQEDSSA